MKASTAVIIGVGGLAVIYIWSRSSSGASILGGPKPPSATTQNLLAAGTGLLGGLTAGWLSSGSGRSSGGSSLNLGSPGQPYIPDTATSNYLADATAASDDETGVVGFGGWD